MVTTQFVGPPVAHIWEETAEQGEPIIDLYRHHTYLSTRENSSAVPGAVLALRRAVCNAVTRIRGEPIDAVDLLTTPLANEPHRPFDRQEIERAAPPPDPAMRRALEAYHASQAEGASGDDPSGSHLFGKIREVFRGFRR